MQTRGGKTLYSAGDVVAFLECEHATSLALVDLVTPLPRAQDDEAAVLVQHKGLAHEARYFESLQASASSVARIASEGTPDARAEATRRAMREGCDVIYQAALLSGPLFGVADFLRRVERPSALGAYSYEVVDTKLARNEKAKFIVQLCFYSDLLAHEQGVDPAAMHVVLGDGVAHTYRVANYSRYFRLVRDRFVAFVGRHPNGTYPEHCSFCELCTWRDVCAAQWMADDHLNQVAGIRRDQIERLREAGVSTLEALAQVDDVAAFGKPPAATVAKLRSQAALQLAYRRTGKHRTEPIELDPQARRGFYRMPEPDAGDVFFDMEGDPFEPDGLEYLFGLRFVDDARRAALQGALGPRPRAGARRVRGADGFLRRADAPLSAHAHLPLRALRADGAQATDVSARRARSGGRRPVAPRHVRRPVPRRVRGAARVDGGLLDQGHRDVLHAAARGRHPDGRGEHRPLRALARNARCGGAREDRALQRRRLPLDAPAARLAAAAATAGVAVVRGRAARR